MDGGACWASVHGVAKSQTQLSDFTFSFHLHALEKEMATHSSVLAWRIPGMGEPAGLSSMGSHRVRHDSSDLAAAAATEDEASTSKVAPFIFLSSSLLSLSFHTMSYSLVSLRVVLIFGYPQCGHSVETSNMGAISLGMSILVRVSQ